jgi:hypothetical protein
MELGASMTYAKRQSLFALVGIAGDTDDMDGTDTGASDRDVRPGARKSSYAMKKDDPGVWPAFEKDIRASTTRKELDLAWFKYSDKMPQWPVAWQEKADEIFADQLDVIGGPSEVYGKDAAE